MRISAGAAGFNPKQSQGPLNSSYRRHHLIAIAADARMRVTIKKKKQSTQLYSIYYILFIYVPLCPCFYTCYIWGSAGMQKKTGI